LEKFSLKEKRKIGIAVKTSGTKTKELQNSLSYLNMAYLTFDTF
jgi:hypothetical protein